MNLSYKTSLRRLSATLAGAAVLALGLAVPAKAAPFPPLNSPASAEQHPGKLVWADLFTSNPDAASKFYTGLLGWTAQEIGQKGSEYTIFSNNGVPVAGLSPHAAGKENYPSKWIGYISVADIKTSVYLVEKNGRPGPRPAQELPRPRLSGYRDRWRGRRDRPAPVKFG